MQATEKQLKASTTFEAEVLPLRGELHSIALRYTRNQRDAEDLVQETMLKAFAAWDSFLPGSCARSWCYRILKNTFITGYRRRMTEQRAASEEPEELRRLTSAGSRKAAEDPESAAVRSQLGDEVQGALGGLSGEFREVLELHYIYGRSYREIARITSVPMGTVMSRLHRARRNLRETLRSYADAQGIGAAALAA
ncbi:MAG: sigma-70 family RNA polymerase sigma factor [Polyangia bacterium]|jgi:RNA polymerase sigma-70 factor (ECF subfamily)|nr:sigma-70 family RNA polymerase sigma factor [Polyangia bacterium]